VAVTKKLITQATDAGQQSDNYIHMFLWECNNNGTLGKKCALLKGEWDVLHTEWSSVAGTHVSIFKLLLRYFVMAETSLRWLIAGLPPQLPGFNSGSYVGFVKNNLTLRRVPS
jgi:hypothetical protein